MITGKIDGGRGENAYFNIQVEGTEKGTTTDRQGVFQLEKVPAGTQTLIFSGLGFKTLRRQVEVRTGEESQVQVKMEPAVLSLDEVVVSATRTRESRRDAPVLVSLLDGKDFESTNSVCLSEGLNYQPGLRMETDCQTCNYTQLRMNGLGGGYTQILINSRPIFSALNGLYGLEQLPVNMIERVEVVRGGGAALYGSSAIAGTVNIITRDPESNGYGISVNQSLIGGKTGDNVIDINASVVGAERKSGLTVFASRRQRGAFDANADGFSEIPVIKNFSFGVNAFWRPKEGSRFGLALNSINEDREGGDRLDLPPHQRLQSESRDSRIISGTLDWTREWSGGHQLMIYGGGQYTTRNHYTGVYFSDGYGNTENTTAQGGLQYTYTADRFWLGPNKLTVGAEYQLDDIFDEISAYEYLIDQQTRQWGTFLQSDWEVLRGFHLLLGTRLSGHNFVGTPVMTPRISALYEAGNDWRLRAGYARGFRAPQAFDADLHIAFAGGGISSIQIDPELEPEFSDSYSFSLDYDRPMTSAIYGFTVSGFYTRLYDAFILEEKESQDGQRIFLEKRNGSHSTVMGVTVEARANFNSLVEFNAGLTFQQSRYDEPVAWSAEVPGTTRYLRTPDRYGFYTVTFLNDRPLKFYLSGVYTGSMSVPHFGGAPGVLEDQMETSPDFWETGLKVSYDLEFSKLSQRLRFFAGVQNVFNAYQSDFDIGPDRDSNYVYGPARPRTYYLGMKFGMFE